MLFAQIYVLWLEPKVDIYNNDVLNACSERIQQYLRHITAAKGLAYKYDSGASAQLQTKITSGLDFQNITAVF